MLFSFELGASSKKCFNIEQLSIIKTLPSSKYVQLDVLARSLQSGERSSLAPQFPHSAILQ